MAWKRFSFVSDSHGDQIDLNAAAAFYRFLKDFKPQLRIHGGDGWDMRPLRRGADQEEQREALRGDFDAGCEFLKTYKPNFYLKGNHCQRLWDLAKNGYGINQEYAQSLTFEAESLFEKLKCQVFPYDKRLGVLTIGKLNAVHGFNGGNARKYAQIYGNVLVGHHHDISSCTIEGLDDRTGRICGCLVKVDMPYNSKFMSALRHRNGWGCGVINDKTGLFHFNQVEGVNGKFIVPEGFKEI